MSYFSLVADLEGETLSGDARYANTGRRLCTIQSNLRPLDLGKGSLLAVENAVVVLTWLWDSCGLPLYKRHAGMNGARVPPGLDVGSAMVEWSGVAQIPCSRDKIVRSRGLVFCCLFSDSPYCTRPQEST